MAPQPKRQRPQREKLTTSLRRVCRDYPAGSVILRELCQNADDAGAREVRLVLDTSTYPSSPLLCDGLAAYQGPALLVYNDAVVSDDDFRSMTSLGDSVKRKDPASTGKFGLGFSSVYNWTDSPAVLSRSTLLLLDPHESWSSHFNPPGGPEYDFVSCADDPEMVNQLAGFSKLCTSWKAPLNATIFRLPLRTESQAAASEIINHKTTTGDVQKSMEMFSQEIGTSGLLFLKSVRKVSLQVGDAEPEIIEIENQEQIRGSSEKLQALLSRMYKGDLQLAEHVFYTARVKRSSANIMTSRIYAVTHLVAIPPEGEKLAAWAKDNKHFPWVAVAAPLELSGSSAPAESERSSALEDPCGGVFCVLPVPIKTGFPIHVHGLFAIAADRSSFERHKDTGVLDHSPRDWNTHLFKEIIPSAWARMLSEVATAWPNQSQFHLWPSHDTVADSVWQDTRHDVLCKIVDSNSKVWYTATGLVCLQDAIIAQQSTDTELQDALRDYRLPVVYLPDTLHSEAVRFPQSTTLCPEAVLLHLKPTLCQQVRPASKKLVLGYLLQSIPLSSIAHLELFPFQDGQYRSVLTKKPAFLSRDEEETELFKSDRDLNLDVKGVLTATLATLHEHAKHEHLILRYRAPAELATYFQRHVVAGQEDFYRPNDEQLCLTEKAWAWIVQRGFASTTPAGMFLIPLRDGTLRKVAPRSDRQMSFFFKDEDAKHVVGQLIKCDSDIAAHVVATIDSAMPFLKALMSLSDQLPTLHLACGDNFPALVDFLYQHRQSLQSMPDTVKAEVLEALKKYALSASNASISSHREKLKCLSLHQTVSWSTTSGLPETQRLSLEDSRVVIGVRRSIPLAASPGRILLDCNEDSDMNFMKATNLGMSLSEVDLVEKVVIDDLSAGRYEGMPSESQRKAITTMLENFLKLSKEARQSVRTLKIVPLKNGKFVVPTAVVDPNQPLLLDLFFDDEVVQPEASFYEKFKSVLSEVGIIRVLDSKLALDRIYTFSERQVPYKTERLLTTPVQKDFKLCITARTSKWLPVQQLDGSFHFKSASECRDAGFGNIVGHVLGILSFQVDQSWATVLGWDDRLSLDTLFTQLNACVQSKLLISVEDTLSYIIRKFDHEDYAKRLACTPFVHTTNGSFVTAAQASRKCPYDLEPYLFVVESRFWTRFSPELQRLGIPPSNPDLPRLKQVQAALTAEDTLCDKDIDVAISIAHIWSNLTDLDGLMLPNQKGVLCPHDELLFKDAPTDADTERKFAHRKVSSDLAELLRIEPLTRMMLRLHMGLEDDDENEFYQREEIVDGIRADLERYPPETTFLEYVTNADDCKTASEVNFMVDDTVHPSEHLLTTELRSQQGAALLIHNNGVFTEKDFEGLKYVGRGSKRDNPTTIGKFGRGHRTMFHFTDCPMILSGSKFLILDPLQRVLPENYRTKKRRAGYIVDYSRLRTTFKDQLAPFTNLWGFNAENDFYNGTIFRFPLRSGTCSSELLETTISPDLLATRSLLRNFFDNARVSLLFLRNLTTLQYSQKSYGGRPNTILWQVELERSTNEQTFAEIIMRLQVQNGLDETAKILERWIWGIEDVSSAPAGLQYRHKRSMKYVEVGMAALLEQSISDAQTNNPNASTTATLVRQSEHRFFNGVPLKFETSLPVHVHATFLLSGDRQSIVIEPTAADAGADWNRWLLTEGIPDFYLDFLGELGRRAPSKIYDFFPKGSSGNHDSLSTMIYSGFWSKVGTSSCQIFPIVGAHDGVAKRAEGIEHRKLRQAPKLVQAQAATFDMLDRGRSDVLGPILSAVASNLVRPKSGIIPPDFRNSDQITMVTPSLVRELLKSSVSPQMMVELTKNHIPLLPVLLDYIKPKTKEDYEELDGCPVLPLQDGTFGRARTMQNGHHKGPRYFIAGPPALEVFAFASPFFLKLPATSPSLTGETFGSCIKKHSDSNVKDFKRLDAAYILGQKKSWCLDEAMEKWLPQFWKYMDEGHDEGDSFDQASFKRFPLVLIKRNDTLTLRSLDFFNAQTVLVEPESEFTQALFKDLPGLQVALKNTLPAGYRKLTDALEVANTMKKFLTAVVEIAESEKQPLGNYLSSSLQSESVKHLRDVLCPLLGDPEVRNKAIDLPLWCPVAKDSPLLTAREALAAAQTDLVLPWMKEYGRFVQYIPQQLLPAVPNGELLKKYLLPYLPQKLDEEDVKGYVNLIRVLHSFKESNSFNLSECALAATLDRKMRQPCDLYDHSDPVFAAAFRSQSSTLFLMQNVRVYIDWWKRLGVKSQRQDKYDHEDYVTAIKTMEARLTREWSAQVADDLAAVIRPLRIEDTRLDNLGSGAWKEIIELPVFTTRLVFDDEPCYRRESMAALVDRWAHPRMAMTDVVKEEFKTVCWSQYVFTTHGPSARVIQRAGLTGKPHIELVWQHLAALAEIAPSVTPRERLQFLEDISATYEHLQNNVSARFVAPDSKIWLNAEASDRHAISCEMLKSEWTSLDKLIIDSPCDAPPLRRVGGFLARYSPLLKAQGCPSISLPRIEPVQSTASQATFASITDMWKENVLVDTRISADGGELFAHKLVLASRSGYLRSWLSGRWTLKYDDDGHFQVEDEMSYETLQLFVAFCYERTPDWKNETQPTEQDENDTIADKLDRLLDILAAADRWVIPDLKAQVEGQLLMKAKFFVRPDNVEEVQKAAANVNAERLEIYCKNYQLENAQAVEWAKGS